MTGLRFDRYDWAGGSEAMLRFGPDGGPLAIVALPLFEEANRTRQFAVTICRALAEHGVGAVLPDFPATGESLIPTRDATLAAIRDAYCALVAGMDRPVFAVGIRSGALLDSAATVRARWQLAPVSGATVLRDLWRIRQIGTTLAAPFEIGRMQPDDYAGNAVSAAMIADLRNATPVADGTLRVVRLESDARPADLKLPGAPLWRRAEPGRDDALAQRLAGDIARWVAACAD